MNKRIADLMLEAGKTIPGDKQIDADFCEKFAELIVRECARICEEGVKTQMTSLGAARRIINHFGVDL